MVRTRVSVNQRRAQRKFKQAQRAIEKGAELGTKEVIKTGKLFARSIVPFDTGWTFRSIRGRTTKIPSGYQGRIFIDPQMKYNHPTRSKKSRGRYGAKFDLVLWMHRSAKARNHITSGNPQFMYATRDYMKGIAKTTIRKKYDELLVRFQ